MNTWRLLDQKLEQDRLAMEQTWQRMEYHRLEMEQLLWEMRELVSWRVPVYDTPQQLHHGMPLPANASMPPTTTNVRVHTPTPPSPCQHSYSLGVAHKRATQPFQLAHATTQEPPQRHAVTPTAKEGTSSAPHHVANRPKDPSALPVRATATWRKRPMTQRRRIGIKVCHPPPCLWGTHPLLADTLRPRNAPRCAEARDAEDVERPGCDPPMATTTRRRCGEDDQRAPRAPPHTTVHRAERPWCCARVCGADHPSL
jgi:hypothetical protein